MICRPNIAINYHGSWSLSSHDHCWAILFTLKSGFQLYATQAAYVKYATQGFTQRTQEVASDMAEICHVVWLASN